MQLIAPSQIDEIFHALNSQIAVADGEPVSLVVIGGTALAAMGFVYRTTKDVDVLGEVIFSGHKPLIKEIVRFPDWLINAAEKVMRDFDLPESWLNIELASQIGYGLPEGLENRLIEKKYGSYLRIFYIAREDQIHFKLNAAVDVNKYEPRHLQDLIALKPTDDEMLTASLWVLEQEASSGFQKDLIRLLMEQGYENVAEKI